MKKILLVFILIYVSTSLNQLFSQNEFAPIGSYWLYSHEPHDGNGYGWDKIKVEKDTIIDGRDLKILSRTFFRQQNLPPLLSSQDESVFGYLSVENDSVFINDHLIFDFSVTAGDTLDVFGGYFYTEEITLVIDSVTTEVIDNVNYKKYFGNKFCSMNGDLEFFQEFQVLESIVIGGGGATFTCFRNGLDFSYPEGSACVEPFLSSTNNQFISTVKIHPNPVSDVLTISNEVFIDGYAIQNIEGRVIESTSALNSELANINVIELNPGVYFIKIYIDGKSHFFYLLSDNRVVIFIFYWRWCYFFNDLLLLDHSRLSFLILGPRDQGFW